MQKWIILIVIVLIIILGVFIVLNVDVETEYTPESEIEDVDLRKTLVTLYFKNKETGEIANESRLIDSKELLRNPYEFLLNLLLEGPENNNYEKIIPEGTELISANLNNECVEVNFNKAFQDANLEKTDIDKALYSIYSTLSELTEVNSIKVLIEGNEVDGISSIVSKQAMNNENSNVDNTITNSVPENIVNNSVTL